MQMHDLSPLWWTQTRFGTIVIVMTFLTWGLVIVDLALLCLVMLNKIFTKPSQPVPQPEIIEVKAAPKRPKKSKIVA